MERTHLWISKEKNSSHLYCLKQHKRSRVAPKELILFYCTCIRSLLEYACPVFNRALPAYLDDDLERPQRRGERRIIYPTLSYAEALSASGLPTISKRREEISSKLFVEISINEGHKLHSLFPEVNTSTYSLRTKDHINYQDVRLNIARTVLYWVTFLITRHLIDYIRLFNYIS